MTQPPPPLLPEEDEQWLSALAGKPDPSANQALNREAAAIRRAMLVTTLSRPHPEPDAEEQHIQRLLFKLRQGRLLEQEPKAVLKDGRTARGAGPLGGTFAGLRYDGLAIAATVLLGLGLVTMQFRDNQAEEPTRQKKGPEDQVDQDSRVESNPEKASKELARELERRGAKVELTPLPDGKFQLIIQLDESRGALEYLRQEERFSNLRGNNRLKIILEPRPGKKAAN
jgi:hypothetical protein